MVDGVRDDCEKDSCKTVFQQVVFKGKFLMKKNYSNGEVLEADHSSQT